MAEHPLHHADYYRDPQAEAAALEVATEEVTKRMADRLWFEKHVNTDWYDLETALRLMCLAMMFPDSKSRTLLDSVLASLMRSYDTERLKFVEEMLDDPEGFDDKYPFPVYPTEYSTP